MTHLPTLAVSLVLSCLLALLPGLLRAQTHMQADLFEMRVVLPAPPWITDPAPGAIAAGSEQFERGGRTENDTDRHLIELTPKGQSREAWTQIYTISGETPLTGPLNFLLNGAMQAYGAQCDNAVANPLMMQPQWQMVAILCGQYKSNPDVGEIAVLSLSKPHQTLIKYTYHIRGPAFDPDDPSSWPMAQAEINDLVTRMATMRITYPPDPNAPPPSVPDALAPAGGTD